MDKIEIFINFEQNVLHEERFSNFTKIMIIKFEGFYKTNFEKIHKNFSTESAKDIMQLIEIYPGITATQIAKISGYAYSLIQKNLKTMKELKLIKGEVTQSPHGMNEVKLYIHENVKIYRGSQFLKNKELFEEFRKYELGNAEESEKDFEQKVKEKLEKKEK